MSYEEINHFIKAIEDNPEFDDYFLNPNVYEQFDRMNNINAIFTYFESIYRQVNEIILSPSYLNYMSKNWSAAAFDFADRPEINAIGIYGHIFTAEVYMSKTLANQVVTANSDRGIFVLNNIR